MITDPSGFSAFNLSTLALTALISIILLSIHISLFSDIAISMLPFSSATAVDAFGLLTSTPVSLIKVVVTIKNISMIKTISNIGVISIVESSGILFFLLIIFQILQFC